MIRSEKIHMKRILSLITAIITIMSFAACGNGDIESGSMGQEISKTEISRQDEQSSEDESSFAEVSEPVSEEASETVSEEISEPVSEEASEQPPEVSEPQQSIDMSRAPNIDLSKHTTPAKWLKS